MVGKKSTLLYINSLLKANSKSQGIKCIRTTTLAIGRTYRWAIAWSFSDSADIPCTIRDRKNVKKEKRRLSKRKRL